jgi:hypothetical protein
MAGQRHIQDRIRLTTRLVRPTSRLSGGAARHLRSLRELGLKKNVIRDAAARVRRWFDTPYGLASKRIATDGLRSRARCATAEGRWSGYRRAVE